MIKWIMFSLYYLFLPVRCIAAPYVYDGYKLCMYGFIRVHAQMRPTALKV